MANHCLLLHPRETFPYRSGVVLLLFCIPIPLTRTEANISSRRGPVGRERAFTGPGLFLNVTSSGTVIPHYRT
jgi:hypothetical protein